MFSKFTSSTRKRTFVTPQQFATDLVYIRGSTFMSYIACFDMLETDGRGQLKKMKKTDNPFIGKSLYKVTKARLSVNFNYESKVETRGGEKPGHHGNWSQVVIVQNQLTPISTHKEDILCKLETDPKKAQLDAEGKIIYCLANIQPILDDTGTVQFTTDDPRLYLRYELMREAGEGPRNERRMQLTSTYYDINGTEIPADKVEQFLKTRPERTDETDVQTTSLTHIAALTVNGITYRAKDIPSLVAQFVEEQEAAAAQK
jgi:hypothetical protein